MYGVTPAGYIKIEPSMVNPSIYVSMFQNISARLLVGVVSRGLLQWVVMKLKCGFPRLKGLGKRFLTHAQVPIRRSIFYKSVADEPYGG